MTVPEPKRGPVLLVASRKKLQELTATAIPPGLKGLPYGAVAALAGLGLFPLSGAAVLAWVASGLKRQHQLKVARRLEQVDDNDLEELFNQVLNLGFPIEWMSPLDARQAYNFGVGHMPTDGSVYMQHPLDDKSYVPWSDFARIVAAEKEAAFLQLAAALGAKSIKLTSIQTNDKRGKLGVSVKLPDVAAELGFKANFDKSGHVISEIVKEFNRPPFSEPRVPERLRAWVDFAPELRIMETDRIESNVAKSQVRLEFSQSLGLGGELSAKLAGRGLSGGGEFRALSHSFWSYEVEYFDLRTV
ncbi:MAG: hypothetical protein KIT72_07505 [Polyangiaceae bacterium]|nr:hypothetical protein [Polyangiaceae bacterium]